LVILLTIRTTGVVVFASAFAPIVLHTLFQLIGEHKPLILAVLNCYFFHAPSNCLGLMARPMRCSWTFINMTNSFGLVGLCLCVTFCAYIIERWGWVCWKVGKHERTCTCLRGRFQGSWATIVYRGNFEDPIFLSRTM
jgi:hypothetical protein